ncbi:MAG: threo-3-hydroxy-L-aspartate ammonia-lyase [Okeania sp. SIO2F4]|uniref:threo-3-hydroxy-L-aspartate ammonia-lyase n=1 Tax=Okeania sp. SIO2F4 TaxID=2607790 RepID=UPI00142BD4E3|nr:threo-3-hydroxy-L-aspartate ammonia-lyase [Okeania sp. SIO2F4]NES05059.1 threo-3-hydroxy-L-aspartate ammonia-lyase [Okeania sp. SIO2F4]
MSIDSSKSTKIFPVNYNHIAAANNRLSSIAHRTPVITSTTVNKLTNCEVFFKCENFQRTGSFKFRGAYNALSQLSETQKQSGVLTYSSGNHAQAIALAGKLLNIPTTIVMPNNAPEVKKSATRGYGAEIIFYDINETTREKLAAKIAEERGYTIIPPYDHPDIIAGQGTTALELIEEVESLDLLLVCCGGGGLLSGCAIATKNLLKNCRVIGVEPKNADDATRSFYSQTLQTVHNPQTIADGARTPYLGKLNFPLVLNYVDDMVTVSEEEILRTMYFIWERMKLVIEPTGALAAAALLEGLVKVSGVRVGVIISGGNVDLKKVGELFNSVVGM